jgi:Uma2 family endonuclease
MTARTVLGYADYVALPDDGKRYEILDGELFVTPAPTPQHQIISGNLVWILEGHVRSRGIGKVLAAPLDVIFADSSIAQPDVVYLDNARMSLISPRGIEGAPNLLVEVLSPTTKRTDRHVKLALYARYDVPFYWIVDPAARALEAYRREGTGYVLALTATGPKPCGPPPFPDLGLVVEALWA